jgi:hypothetical protein
MAGIEETGMRVDLTSSMILLGVWGSVFGMWPTSLRISTSRVIAAEIEETPHESTPKENQRLASRYLDPAQFMMPELLRNVPQRFADISLIELSHLLKSQFQIDCLLDKPGLEGEGLTGDETVTLPEQTPLYLALERAIENVGGTPLGWYVDDDVLVITSKTVADELLVTRSLNVQPLLDAGFKGTGPRDNLRSLIQNATSGPWFDLDGEGGQMDLVGNVLVVRQSQREQQEVARLLRALEQRARLAYVSDPPQNEMIREALQHPCPINVEGKPLDVVISEIGNQLHIPVDLDLPSLQAEGLTGTEEVNLSLENKPARTILRFLLQDIGGTPLTAIPEWGVLRVTTQSTADEKMATVVLDVSDLLGVVSSQDLIVMIQSETNGPWYDVDGEGGTIDVTPHGCLVIRQNEKNHQEVIKLLEQQRQLLSLGKPLPKKDLNAVETRYYRFPEKAALDLLSVIPQEIAPETWKSMGHPDAIGTISLVSIGLQSRPPQGGFLQMGGMGESSPKEKPAATTEKKEQQATLIIRQSVAVHEKIERFVNELLYGDPDGPQTPQRGMCGGMMGGGIGGGTGGGMGEMKAFGETPSEVIGNP